MKTVKETGRFINTRLDKPSVLRDEKNYAGLFRSNEDGCDFWINLTEEQYSKVKCHVLMDIEYSLDVVPIYGSVAQLTEMKRSKQ